MADDIGDLKQDNASYRRAMRLIVEDEDIQAGAATFRGTRILVHQIAALLRQGADERELREGYPNLTPEMIAAAPVFAHAHPDRGLARTPSWRGTARDTGKTC